MLKEKNTKTSKLGLLSLLCLFITFILVGNTGSLIANDNIAILWVVVGLLFLSVILAIAGLVVKKQNKKNNVFSVMTLVMIVGIFVLGMV